MPIAADKKIVTDEAIRAELDEKHARLNRFLDERKLAAVLLRRHENIAWATAGQVEMRVLIPAETGVGSLLIAREGKKYYFTTKNEAPRLAAEEFAGAGYEPVLSPWYDDGSLEAAQKIAGSAEVGTDTASAGFVPVDFSPLRASLPPAEVDRYRWLGRVTADVTADVLQELEPGITEYEMEALVADGLLCAGIFPSVLLMAVDNRIMHYRHAVARGRKLERYGMLNLCARKWGLAISITRFVHFGALPEELKQRFASAARVNAALLDATRVGATSAELFQVTKNAYSREGFQGEEELHHQGGATGYGEREWLATPTGTERVENSQAFAWNPSIRGAKVEDTVVLLDGKIECLTSTPDLPVVETAIGDIVYRSAGVLIRN